MNRKKPTVSLCKNNFKNPNRLIYHHQGFFVAQTVNDLPFNLVDPGSIPGPGRSPAEREWLPTPVFLPG